MHAEVLFRSAIFRLYNSNFFFNNASIVLKKYNYLTACSEPML